MGPLLRFLWLPLYVTSTLAVIGPVSNLVISNKIVKPDGFAREAVLAGDSLPGPLIQATKGERFIINVIDKLTNESMLKATSIHWHGLFQKGTNWDDGAAFVNQCPVASGDSFVYDFSPADQTNTYWYHSHLAIQYCDGLRGPIVIYDPNDPFKHLYDIDDESTVITLMEWYHEAAPSLPLGSAANSTLINGLGRYIGGPASPLSVITVQHGKRYRMRLVSMACDPNFTFSIDQHKSLTIIEADGQSTQPHVVDSIQIFAAQRYSFILNANQPVGNYWIRAQPNIGPQGFAGGVNSAILRYVGALESDPKTAQSNSTNPLIEANLSAYNNPAAPGKPFIGGADVNLVLNLAFNATTGLFSINGVPFVPPTVPVLLQILSGAHTAQELLPKGSVYVLPENKVIEVSILIGNAPGGPHPFHLHGDAFSVVRSAGQTTPNFANPVRRDTVSTGTTSDNVTFRFTTNNSGPFFLHCHIEFHLNAGLAIVFAEDIPDTKLLDPVPSEWEALCPIYNRLSPGDL